MSFCGNRVRSLLKGKLFFLSGVEADLSALGGRKDWVIPLEGDNFTCGPSSQWLLGILADLLLAGTQGSGRLTAGHIHPHISSSCLASSLDSATFHD